MKAFRFRLQRVLELRESEVKTEETQLERLRTRRAQMEAERLSLVNSLERATVSVRGQQFLHMFDLAALDRYKERVKRELQEWDTRLTRQDAEIDKQMGRVVAARGRVKLMEKLRERRHVEWQSEADREMEELTSDFAAAQWLREQG